MLSELYIVKIDCHVLKNSLRSVKLTQNTIPTIFFEQI